MKHLAPSWYRSFACAAGACPDSCCRAGWEIVPDPETLALYENLPGAAGARAREGIVLPRSGAQCAPPEPLLRQNADRVCVLLDPDGLCCVQKAFGHGALCRVCRDYPRFRREFGGLTEHGLSLSCPTAYALATRAPLTWETWEDEAPPVLNDIDPERYRRLREGRGLALELLGREDLPLLRRIDLVQRLAAALQQAPERLLQHDLSLRVRRWSTLPRNEKRNGKNEKIWSFANRDLRNTFNCQLSIFNCQLPRLAARFAALEILSPAWAEALERFRSVLRDAGAHCAPLRDGLAAGAHCAPLRDGLAAGAHCAPLQVRANRRAGRGVRAANGRPYGQFMPSDPEVYARYLACSLYKYWMDALDDGNLTGRVRRSVEMTLLGLAMDQALPGEGPFLRRISREIEHCEENLAALLEF